VIGPTPADAAAGFINKLTGAAPLSRERLGKFAGRTAVFHVGPFDAAFTVQTTGEVLPAVETATKDLEVRLSPFLLPRLAARDETAFRDVQMTGDAEFAAEIAFLSKNLKWDVEEDLSKVMGDAAAHRAVGAATAAAGWGKDAAERLAASAAEYFTEESPLIASRVKVAGFVDEVSLLRDAVERLEKRIDILENNSGSGTKLDLTRN
jgi:ubiquinone biosynthesis accessory factor UbiJ